MNDSPDELARVAADYWQAYLSAEPIHATALGERSFDDRLDDPSPAAVEARRREIAALGERAAAIDPDSLADPADALTRSALLAQLDADAARLASGLVEWSVDPLDGPQVFALNLVSFQSVATPEQGAAMVARWERMGDWFDAWIANVRSGIAGGRVAVRMPVERVIDQLREIIAMPDEVIPLLAPAREPHPDWPATAVQSFRDDLATAVRERVRPALARYLAVLETEVLPRARPDDRAGLVHLPGGAETYQRLIMVHTSLDRSAEEIHAIGLDEVARIDGELLELGSRVTGAGTLPELLARLRSDTALHFTTGDEVFATASRALQRARDAIPEWFGILPRANCVVVRMPAHEERHSTIAYYREPAADGSRPGNFYINTSEPATRPRYEAEALAYHEAIPGHHLQIAIAQELHDLPAFRRHLGPTAFVEGWGLYTERLSDEMGLYSGDLDRIGILSFDAWRACRLVVDTGMHALGWTRRQAIDYLVAHTALAENNIANEVDRYIVGPGQALAYKLGQLEILRLREQTRARLGAAFDVRAFHDAVLDNGPIGLRTLGEVVAARFGGRAAR